MLELAKTLNLSESLSDLFEDIGVGICGNQMLTNGEALKTVKSEQSGYKPKTLLVKTINDILIPMLDEIHLDNQWKGEKEFIAQGTEITLIQWFNGDSCMIKYDEQKEIKVNKKYFRELYESRNIIEKIQRNEYEQISFLI